MIEIDQFIVLLLKKKTEEMEEFKSFIGSSKLYSQKITYKEWKESYLNWALQQEEALKKTGKIPRILLSND